MTPQFSVPVTVNSRIFPVLLVFSILLCTVLVGQAAGSGIVAEESGFAPVIEAYFFYGDGCIHCEYVKPHLADLAKRHPRLQIRYLEVYHNTTNQEAFGKLAAAYGIETPGVPTLVLGNHILIGDLKIRNDTESLLMQLEQEKSSATPAPVITPAAGEGGCPSAARDLTLPIVIGCALIDSVNPCAFAVLVFLLLSIITLESRRRVLMVGGAYIAAVFVFYLLSGMGLFAVVQGSGFSQVLFVGAAVLSIILGLVNIADVIRKNEGFTLAIPASKKEVIERYIRTASLPAAFVLGILVGIFELPCTGGIYLAILSMMSRTLTFSQGLPYLLLYNFIFVLPLIVILLVVAFGLSPERVNSWRLENRRLLRLAIGIAMVAIGAIMLSGWI